MRHVLLILPLLLAGCVADTGLDAAMRENDVAMAAAYEGLADDIDAGHVQFAGIAKALQDREAKAVVPEALRAMDESDNGRQAAAALRDLAASRRRVSSGSSDAGMWFACGAIGGLVAGTLIERRRTAPKTQGAKP